MPQKKAKYFPMILPLRLVGKFLIARKFGRWFDPECKMKTLLPIFGLHDAFQTTVFKLIKQWKSLMKTRSLSLQEAWVHMPGHSSYGCVEMKAAKDQWIL